MPYPMAFTHNLHPKQTNIPTFNNMTHPQFELERLSNKAGIKCLTYSITILTYFTTSLYQVFYYDSIFHFKFIYFAALLIKLY